MALIVERSARVETPEQRLTQVFDLYETSEIIVRENVRRRDPDAGEREIEDRLDEWRRERPGAALGDASGPDFRPRR
jgi:hypothetical protein